MDLVNLLLIAFSAIVVENFIFSRFLGVCPFLGVSKQPATAFGMGLAVTFVITVSNFLTFEINDLILKPYGLEFLQTIAFILVIAVLVQLLEMFFKRYIPVLYHALGIYLPLITTNCAVLGAALLAVESYTSVLEATFFGFASSIGFLVALLIFAGVRERLVFAHPPRAFEGMPLALISAGLCAMAFSGFSGIQL
ncbi:MAG: RnfABCDGE type electron transport complex subunit A [Clostridia bacterium]|nr:RnfABCDGE type electron transport complex subunit A [Clostridia bacterium]